jgi:hypothetical protein
MSNTNTNNDYNSNNKVVQQKRNLNSLKTLFNEEFSSTLTEDNEDEYFKNIDSTEEKMNIETNEIKQKDTQQNPNDQQKNEETNVVITNDKMQRINANFQVPNDNFAKETFNKHYETESEKDYPWLSSLLKKLIVDFKELYFKYVALQHELKKVSEKFLIKRFNFPNKEKYISFDSRNNDIKNQAHLNLIAATQIQFIQIEQAAIQLDITNLYDKMFSYNFSYEELKKHVEIAYKDANEMFNFKDDLRFENDNNLKAERMIKFGTNWLFHTVK